MTRTGTNGSRGRVLVTGAAGFIGRRCVDDLTERGYEVHAVSSRRREAVPGGAIWHQADLLAPGRASEVVDAVRPGHLLHLAWETGHGTFWTSPENLRWIGASIELVRAFAESGGRRAVVAGTCAEYRWADEICSERTTPLEPRTLYGACKHALHVALAAYAAPRGLELAWGRVFHLHGSGEHPARLVPSVASAMLAGEPAPASHGRQLRDLMHVDDVADAFVALLASDVTGAVNVASGDPVALADVARLIGEITGRPDLLRLGAIPQAPHDPALLVADTRRLRDEVGWRPRHDLRSGLRLTIDGLREGVRA